VTVEFIDNRPYYARAPHHHHHHHHDDHHEYEKIVVSGDHDHVHAGRSPHHHHHHHDHHEHEKIIISGDNDRVHVDRSVFIAGEQGQSYVVPHIAKRNVAQELFTVPSLRRRANDLNGVPGHVDIMVCILVNRP
jgi:hypothetical protein